MEADFANLSMQALVIASVAVVYLLHGWQSTLIAVAAAVYMKFEMFKAQRSRVRQNRALDYLIGRKTRAQLLSSDTSGESWYTMLTRWFSMIFIISWHNVRIGTPVLDDYQDILALRDDVRASVRASQIKLRASQEAIQMKKSASQDDMTVTSSLNSMGPAMSNASNASKASAVSTSNRTDSASSMKAGKSGSTDAIGAMGSLASLPEEATYDPNAPPPIYKPNSMGKVLSIKEQIILNITGTYNLYTENGTFVEELVVRQTTDTLAIARGPQTFNVEWNIDDITITIPIKNLTGTVEPSGDISFSDNTKAVKMQDGIMGPKTETGTGIGDAPEICSTPSMLQLIQTTSWHLKDTSRGMTPRPSQLKEQGMTPLARLQADQNAPTGSENV
jgi:hypothetical protein